VSSLMLDVSQTLHIFYEIINPFRKLIGSHPSFLLYSHTYTLFTPLNIIFVKVFAMEDVEWWYDYSDCIKENQDKQPFPFIRYNWLDIACSFGSNNMYITISPYLHRIYHHNSKFSRESIDVLN